MVQRNAQMRITIVGGKLYSLEKRRQPPPSKIVKFMLRREAQCSSLEMAHFVDGVEE